jgi:hypothetical protein
MRIEIAIAGTEHEAATELERILSEPMLAVAAGARPLTRGAVVASEHVEQIARFKAGSIIGDAFFIDQQRKIDLRLFAKQPRVINIAKADGCQPCAGCLKFLLVLAQLRDMLTAEDSAVVPKENQYGWAVLPK